MVPNGCHHAVGIVLEQIDYEAVRMLRREGVGRQAIGRKVSQVGCHNHIRSPVDRRGQDVAVIGIRQIELLSKDFISGHDGIGKVLVHDRAGPVQHDLGYLRPVDQKAPCPFRMDAGAPQWREQISVGETQQQVAKAGRIEDIGVKQRRQSSHCLLQAEFLVASGQFVKGLAAAGFGFAAVVKDILDTDATV